MELDNRARGADLAGLIDDRARAGLDAAPGFFGIDRTRIWSQNSDSGAIFQRGGTPMGSTHAGV